MIFIRNLFLQSDFVRVYVVMGISGTWKLRYLEYR
jgi:hypothetical protein